MAPELLKAKPGGRAARLKQPLDIYAFGMVIYEVLTGSDPFHDCDPGMIRSLILSGERPKKPGNAEEIGFGNGIWELVRECWRDIPMWRPAIERVLAHLARKSSGMGIQKSPTYECFPPVSRDH